MRRQAGLTLLELLVVAAIAGLALLLVAPPLARAAAGLELRLAAHEVAGSLREARAYSIRHAAYVAVRFRTGDGGAVGWGLYRDGDGDGVRNDDIDDGVDPPAAPERAFHHFGSRIRFGFPPGPPPQDPSNPRRRLDRLDDPIRFGRSELASFSPLEGASPGSVYLTDGGRRLLCVRVDHRTGRPRILTWDAATRRWS